MDFQDRKKRMPTAGGWPWSRRAFLEALSFVSGGLALGALAGPTRRAGATASGMAVSELPKGAAPPALDFPHFPTRLHAFVWRNWTLVPVERIAKVVGASKSDVVRMGRAMGLGGPPRISASIQARSYITVIRRNWHLLPYEQLLELLEWTPEQLGYVLREDDFLFIKLGSLKPANTPLRYEPPDMAVLAREREIQGVMKMELPALAKPPEVELFGFLETLSKPAKTRGRPTSASAPLRFCYSYFALYGDPLLETEADPYPEGLLSQLAAAGVNGVWLQAVLYKLAPFPWNPDLSARYQERLQSLKKLVARAGRQGIRVFLYLNEPRAMPLRFFETQPQLKGVAEGDHATLCTSDSSVQRYLTESVAAICAAVPGLGGFFTITASENLTNCWSHGAGAKCPRCGARTPAAVIAEVNSLLWQGIQSAGSKARLIAWDWGWSDAWAPEAIGLLPKAISFMSVSEWRLPIERGGVRTEVGEYSISAVGPGPRAMRHWQLARERGLQCLAKIQAGNTWELSTVPYIPAVANVARHAENLHRAGVTELMLGWTLGGYPSPNLEVVAETGRSGSGTEGMKTVAERRFGVNFAPAVVKAWRQFSEAFSEFPYHGGVVYSGPQHMGPANLLWAKPTGYRATMVGFPYDDLDAWRAVYPPEVFVQQLDKVADGFERALKGLEAETRGVAASAAYRRALAGECRVAEAAMIHFRSSANQARFLIARKAMAKAANPEETGSHRDTCKRVLLDEITLARRLCELQSRDSRLGFEASNHYFFVPADLAEKILNCRYLLEHQGRTT